MQKYQVIRFDVIDSTNNYVKELKSRHPVLCIADTQTSGRGRAGKLWQSPPGKNIYCSIGLALTHNLANIASVNLVIAIAVVKTLEFFNIPDLKIKWPNDVFWHGQKLSGILTELVTHMQPWWLVIGVGINVNSTFDDLAINRPWTSILQILGQHLAREEIIQKLIEKLDYYLIQFELLGINSILSEWHKYDFLFGKKISVIQNKLEYHGICKGINQDGALKLQTETGQMINIVSGELHYL
jgi:BirA family biotin operon repressor/biotin-[acetyl-CoA-carboxylase] ligase